MEELTPQKLASLFDKTNSLLGLHNQKSKWRHIYPLLSQLAHHYERIYQYKPQSLQAQFSLYVPSYGYTTNLVVNQCVVTTALCKSLGYDSQITQQLICVSLSNYLCVQEQSNKLAAKQPLNEQEKRQWQCRHQLAVKLLQAGEMPVNGIALTLARLTKYKYALLNTPKTVMYDNATTLVALANIIAANITYRTCNSHISFFKAIADIYIRTPNRYAQHALKSLIAHIGPHIPGSLVTVNEQPLRYITTTKQRLLLVDVESSKQKVKWHSVKGNLPEAIKQQPCTDKRLLFAVWFSEHIKNPVLTVTNNSNYLSLISQIKSQNEYSYKGLEKIIGHDQHTVDLICHAVRHYNNEHQVAKDLRHSLSMVGIFNAPAIIQRVLFEQLANQIQHPYQQHIQTRLSAIIDTLSILVKHSDLYYFEQLTIPIYGYVNYLLTMQSPQLSRKIFTPQLVSGTVSTPLAAIFGVAAVDNKKLTAFMSELLPNNEYAQALLNAEQHKKSDLDEAAKLWVTLKLLILQVFVPDMCLSSWQKEVSEQTLQMLGWDDAKQLNIHIQSLGLSNSI